MAREKKLQYTVINMVAHQREWVATEAEAIRNGVEAIEKHKIDGTLVVVKGLRKLTRTPKVRQEKM